MAESRSTTFGITDDGIARLRELLAEPPQEPKPRNGLMLRLFFGSQLGADACRQLVLQNLQHAQAQLAEFEVAREELLRDSRLTEAAPYIALTISAGEHSARAAIAWANEALAQLAEMSSSA